jgi:hypothetical protein
MLYLGQPRKRATVVPSHRRSVQRHTTFLLATSNRLYVQRAHHFPSSLGALESYSFLHTANRILGASHQHALDSDSATSPERAFYRVSIPLYISTCLTAELASSGSLHLHQHWLRLRFPHFLVYFSFANWPVAICIILSAPLRGLAYVGYPCYLALGYAVWVLLPALGMFVLMVMLLGQL